MRRLMLSTFLTWNRRRWRGELPVAAQSDLRYFHAFIAEKSKNRVTAAIGQVNGRPALVITPGTDAYAHSNPGVVAFNLNGVDISIYSNTYGTDALLAIASSMR